MGYLSNIKKQYLISFFYSLVPAYVIERLFGEQRGMTVLMVVWCEILYAGTVAVLELPSGVLADRLGRKPLLILAAALHAAQFVILLFAHGFALFAVSALVAAVGTAMDSGSDRALLYESLQAHGRQDDFEKVLGRREAADFAGSVLAALSGSLLAQWAGYSLNYILSAGSGCAAVMLTLTLREPPGARNKPSAQAARRGLGAHAREAAGVFRAYPLLLIYCASGAVLGACLNYLDEFWQLALKGVGVPVALFGVIAIASSLRSPGSVIAYRLKGLRTGVVVGGVLVLDGACYLAVCLTRSAWCLVPMMAVFLASGVAEPLLSGYLHHRTDSAVRATVESASSLLLRITVAGVGLAFGYVSAASVFDGFGLLAAVCGGSAAVLAGVYLLWRRRRDNTSI